MKNGADYYRKPLPKLSFPPHSGKSTQLPLYLYENGWCENDFQVVCTQPRRIAAQTLAKRVSEELGMGPSTVGYTVRFDDNTSDATKIKFVTDGMLLREASLHDPLLSRYSVVIIDEAHERNLISDALLGLLLRVRKKRKDLRVIVCSATIDAEAFLNFFVKKSSAKDGMQPNSRKRRWGRRLGEEAEQKNDPDRLANSGMIISVDGRQHSVDVLYLSQPTSHYGKSGICPVIGIARICHVNRSQQFFGHLLMMPFKFVVPSKLPLKFIRKIRKRKRAISCVFFLLEKMSTKQSGWQKKQWTMTNHLITTRSSSCLFTLLSLIACKLGCSSHSMDEEQPDELFLQPT